MTTSHDFIALLQERGQLHQCSDEAGLRARFGAGIVTGYIGYDCTAPSLHVGHLANMMMLRLLQQVGGRPLVIMGGGTTKIGDPSFRDDQRKLADEATINANMASIKTAFDKVMAFGSGPADAIMINNADWLDELAYIPFLRDVGRYFSVNRMLSFESVKTRMEREQSLSFLEFNYMILQAYDFLELSRRAECRLQMGGSDQWGNIVNGIELSRRVDGKEVYGLTSPLITTADGGKMGKTARGAVWLNEDQLPAYDYWQFWRNTQDADVGRFLRLFTDLPLDEIARLERLEGAEINEAKKVLANEATAMIHGREAAEGAGQTAAATFAGGAGEDLPSVSLAQAPSIIAAISALGFATSNKESRRKLDEGAIRVNDEVVHDPAYAPQPGDKISFGRKKHGVIIEG